MRLLLNQTAKSGNNSNSKIRLRISWRFLLAFFALMIITSELHEQTHINTGRLICGGYGERDFNAWTTAAACAHPSWAFLATLVGPLYSYCVMWTGALILLKGRSPVFKSIGFTLVFAPLPFARIFTVLIGGGDEKTVLLTLLENLYPAMTIKIIAAIVVTAICLPPIIIAYRSLKNQWRLLYVAGFSVLPLVVLGIYTLTFLNSILNRGVLSSAPFLGTPLLIIFHFLLMLIILISCRKWLLELTRNPYA